MLALFAAPIEVKTLAVSQVSAWTGPRIAFALVAALVLGGAIATVVSRNPVMAVMSLVATFFGLAAAFTFLYAHFLAALQVLVYAGAIMVLFIFVVMVLNRDDPDRVALRGLFLKGIGLFGSAYAVGIIARKLLTTVPVRAGQPPESFGTVAEVGQILFTDYLFAFEAISILLLIAVVAAVVVARSHKHPPPGADEPLPADGPAEEHH
jgi:NADH-quinone oxidoreductase subunit J